MTTAVARSRLLELLAARGVRLRLLPDLGTIHPEIRLEAPVSIAAEISLGRLFQLGAFSHLNGGFIQNVRIGRYCSFARDVQIGHGCHPTNWLSVSPLQYVDDYRAWTRFVEGQLGSEQPVVTQPFRYERRTEIGHDVWIGNHVIVKDGVTIGNGAIVGAGAVVTADVAPYAIVVGHPARVLRMRFDERVVERLQAVQWWQYALGSFGPLDFSDVESSVSLIEDRVAAGLSPYVAPTVTANDIQVLGADPIAA